jgi:hypothetical protein
MARYIDKEFEINHYHSMLVNPTPDVTSIDKRNAMIILDALKMAKTVDVPDRNVGKWIYGESEIGNDGYYCSVCGNFVPWKYDEYDIDFIKEFLFCNKCGASMRPQFEEPEINPCRGCEDYDGEGGCKTKGGCADRRGDSDE